MPCEMCGDAGPTRRVKIEGTVMDACPKCARFGVEVARPPSAAPVRRAANAPAGGAPAGPRPPVRDVYDEHPETLVPGFGRLLRMAREKRGVSIEELGLQINEKKTVLAKVEDESLVPSDALVRKLEKSLDVKLLGKPESAVQPGTTRAGPVTFGDLLKDATDKPKRGR